MTPIPSAFIPFTEASGFWINVFRFPTAKAPGTINMIPTSKSRLISRTARKSLKVFFELETSISKIPVSPVSEAFFAIPIAPAVKKDCTNNANRKNAIIKNKDSPRFSEKPFHNMERISLLERVAGSIILPVLEVKNKMPIKPKKRT